MKLLAAGLLLVHAPAARSQVSGPDPVRRLAPSQFRQLPAPIRRDLEARACLVPQPWDARTPQNVIRGAFTAAHVTEWAVLCSLRGNAQILIYRVDARRNARVVDSLRSSSETAWTQDVGGGRLGYSRRIRTRPLDLIRRSRVDADGNRIPQPIDHDAIEDEFLDKAAESFYFAKGRWYRQVTAD